LNEFNDRNRDSIVRHLKSFPRLKSLSIKFNETPSTYLRIIRELSHLKSLRIEFVENVDDEDLKSLSKINNITKLKLIECEIVNSSKYFKEFKNLKSLILIGSTVIDLLKNLDGTEIKHLNLRNDNISSCDDLIHLKKMKRLESLEINSEYLYGLIHIKEMKSLTRLKLNWINQSPTLIVILNELKSIEDLTLIIKIVYCAELVHLNELKHLKRFRIKWIFYNVHIVDFLFTQIRQLTNITDMSFSSNIQKEKIDLLREYLPNTKIKIEN
jgi:hypothetical protein